MIIVLSGCMEEKQQKQVEWIGNWVQAVTYLMQGAVKPASSICHTSGRPVGINREITPTICSCECLGRISSLSKAPRFHISYGCWWQKHSGLHFQLVYTLIIHIRLVDNWLLQNTISHHPECSISLKCHWTIYGSDDYSFAVYFTQNG